MLGSTRCYNAAAVGKKLTVILGAGASHDLFSTPVTRVDNLYEPPLAAELFTYREPFARILDNYPRARALAATITARVRQGESPETVLRMVRDSGEEHLVRQFRHVPLYLQELFLTISRQYTTEPVNYTHLMNSVLGSDFDKVAFVTLNYDLFLEKSLEGIDGSQPKRIDQYAMVGRKWMLIKLHGSADWGRLVLNTPRGRESTNAFALELVDQLPLIENDLGDIEITGGSRWRNDKLMYPAITVPVEGKYEYACPPGHLQALKEFLAACGDFLIIGVSGQDEDLLDLLNENVKRCTHVMIVGHTGVEEVEARLVPRVEAFARLSRERYEGGFSNFMMGHLDQFLQRLG